MSGLLYFIPGATPAVTIGAILGHGLGYAFSSPGDFTPCGCSSGPGEAGGGVVIADSRHTERIGFYPDEQIWQAIPNSAAWVGMYPDDRPAPADLQRAAFLDGHFVRLEDGHEWLIPVARGVGEIDGELVPYDKLPHAVGVDGDGNWSRNGAISKYERLWKIALRWWDELQRGLDGQVIEAGKDVGIDMDFNDVADGAVEALTTNYRLHKAEVALLGLLSDRVMYEVLHAVVDMPTIQAFAKKSCGSVRKIPRVQALGARQGSPIPAKRSRSVRVS